MPPSVRSGTRASTVGVSMRCAMRRWRGDSTARWRFQVRWGKGMERRNGAPKWSVGRVRRNGAPAPLRPALERDGHVVRAAGVVGVRDELLGGDVEVALAA